MQDFRNLKVWEKSHELTLAAYRLSGGFPQHEQFGVRSQLRRAIVSIPTNLAEGCGRGSDADFGRFTQIAMGSACEADYLLLLARDLGYFTPEDHARLAAALGEVKKMLAGLLNTLAR